MKDNMQKTDKPARRFQVRFSNGFWKSFDTEEYTSVDIHLLKKEAVQAVRKLNGEKNA